MQRPAGGALQRVRHARTRLAQHPLELACDRAIEIGSEQLANLPSDVDIRERQLLEEAVGDAWQNIAVMMREHQDAKFPAYQRFCEEANKFYPYQRREAAALLRDQGASALGSTARAQIAGRNSGSSISSANLGTARQGGAAEALKKSMPEIEKYAAEGNFDAALTTLDKIAKDCKRYAPFHLVCGQMNWRLANQARDNGRKGTEAFYKDAVRAFQRAVDLDPEPNAPRQQLAQAQYDAGETPKASETISSLCTATVKYGIETQSFADALQEKLAYVKREPKVPLEIPKELVFPTTTLSTMPNS